MMNVIGKIAEVFFEKMLDYLKEHMDMLNGKKRNMQLAPYAFLALIAFAEWKDCADIICELLKKGTLYTDLLEGLINCFIVFAAYSASLLVSFILVPILSAMPWYDGTFVYEKIDSHYYLKESYVPIREKMEFVISYPIAYIMAVVAIMFLGSSYEILRSSLGASGNQSGFSGLIPVEEACKVVDYLLVWLGLKICHLSGRSYEEEKKFLEGEQKHIRSDGSLLRITDRFKNSVRQVMLLQYPLKLGISYPDNSYVHRYFTLFNALFQEDSVFVENIFYHDWGNAFFLPLNRMLVTDRKAVIFAGISSNEKDLFDWIKIEFRNLNPTEKSWKIEIWDENVREYDVCIVPYSRIYEFITSSVASPQNAKGIFCLILEPSRMLAEMQYYLEIYADFIRKLTLKPVYCFADRNVVGISDYLSHIFRCKIIYFEVSMDRSRKIFLCTSDNSSNDEVKAYWGMQDGAGCGSVFFAELLKNLAERIVYVSECIRPARDVCELAKVKALQQAVSQEEQLNIEKVFGDSIISTSIGEIERKESQFMIVEDELCNWYDLYWLLSTRAERFVGIFLLSGSYLLNDFMVRNAHRLLKVRNAVPILYPVYQDTKKNRLLKIIRRVAGRGQNILTLDEIREIFTEIETQDLRNVISELNTISDQYFQQRIFMVNADRISVNRDFILHNSVLWETVELIDEEKEHQMMGCILACHLDQKWLEGQYIVREGRYYQIKSSRNAGDKRELVLLRSKGYLRKPGMYYQIRSAAGNQVFFERAILLKSSLTAEYYVADITVNTYGWRRKVYEGTQSEYYDTQYIDVPERSYRQKPFLFIRFVEEMETKGMSDYDFWSETARLLEEMSRTLFPMHYQYLIFKSISPFHQPSFPIAHVGLMVIEDCADDLGLLESVDKNLDCLLNLCYEYMDWQDTV